MTADLQLDLVLPQNATLGEGLLWQGGRWWWTDIEAATLFAWKPGSPAPQFCRLPDRLGSFAHCRSGRVLLGLAKRLAVATLGENLELTQLQTLAPVDAAEPRTRINDGRTDRSGNFVFGTLNEAKEKRPIASFYQYSVRHGLRRLALPAVAIANSICFSLDGRTMYFCDSPSRRILQCDYDAETARVDRLRPFTEMDRPDAEPDGSVIDAEGCLWNAQWGAGRPHQLPRHRRRGQGSIDAHHRPHGPGPRRAGCAAAVRQPVRAAPARGVRRRRRPVRRLRRHHEDATTHPCTGPAGHALCAARGRAGQDRLSRQAGGGTLVPG
jgi:sugar lactone lactonase YvrE